MRCRPSSLAGRGLYTGRRINESENLKEASDTEREMIELSNKLLSEDEGRFDQEEVDKKSLLIVTLVIANELILLIETAVAKAEDKTEEV